MLYRIKLDELSLQKGARLVRGKESEQLLHSPTAMAAAVNVPPIYKHFDFAVLISPDPTARSVDWQRLGVFFILAVGMVVTVIILGVHFGKRLTRDLGVLEFFARGVAEKGFGTGRAEAANSLEVASLAQSINGMLDRLKQQHDKLHDSEMMSRSLTESIAEGVITTTTENIVLEANAAALQLFGYEKSELIGRDVSELVPERHHRQYKDTTAALAAQPEAFRIPGREVRSLRKDGSEFSASMSFSDVQVGGRRLFTAVILDITERKRAEAELFRFKNVLDNTLDMIFMFEPESLRFVYVNQGVVLSMGYSREELLGMTPYQIKPLMPEPKFRQLIAPLLSGEQPSLRFETLHRRKDDTDFWVAVFLQLVTQSDGSGLFVAIVHDITERKQAEAARAALEAQLHESQKMEAMGTLAGGIAHDFNNILAAIRGNTMLAKQDLQARPDDALVSLEEIDKAAKRAKDLVQRILIFSRKGVQTFAVQPVRPLVEESMRLLRSTLPTGVELAAELADAPLYASVDATQIEQVLINLCTNACDAMKGRSGRIEVGLTEVLLDQTPAQGSPDMPSGQYLRIHVSDNGDGMDEATQARIFEPFFTTKGVGLGTGLGLSVVHGIVKAHQGAITVESTPGKGTTFLVYLPAAAAPAEAERVTDAAPALSAAQGKRVLYVDDDEAMVFLVTRMLEDLGYRVSGFDRGEAALEAVRADPQAFDLIVTDFNMPGLSGLQVAEELQRIRPGLPVVITSGYITDELTAAARAVGVSQVVYKPNTVDELCRTIQQLLLIETGQT